MLKSTSFSFSFSFLTEILSSPRVKPLAQRLHPSTILAVVRGVFDDVSRETIAAATELRRPDLTELFEKIVGRLTALLDVGEPSTIDARGRIFADDFERPAGVALEEAAWKLAEPRTEYSERKDAVRMKETLERLCRATGAESAAILANLEAARLAVLETLSTKPDAEIVVARRDLYERENGDRLESALDFFPIVRREIGACNAVDLGDYSFACNEKTRLIWKSKGRWSADEPGGRNVSAEELEKLRTSRKLSFDVLGEFEFAPLIDLSKYFDSPIPTVGERLRGGFDLVLCDGAQLIGGPPCGLVFGPRNRIDAISRTRTAAIAKIGRVDAAALAKTIEISCENRDLALAAIPALRILSTSLANLESRANRLAAILETFPAVECARAVEGRSALCANSTFGSSPTRLVEIRPNGFSPAELTVRLENESPRLLVRWTRDAAFLDMKTVPPEQDVVVAEIFEKIAPPQRENPCRFP